MLTCKEVSRAISSDKLFTAGWRQRLAVRLHLLMCRHCRRYARQIDQIGEAARQMFSVDSADPDTHERLRSSILTRIPDSTADDSHPKV